MRYSGLIRYIGGTFQGTAAGGPERYNRETNSFTGKALVLICRSSLCIVPEDELWGMSISRPA